MTKLCNLNAMLGGYFKLCFIIAKVDNLDANLGGYFELSFVMAEVGNLHAKLGVTLCIFHNSSGG
jgi:hypothetical protein